MFLEINNFGSTVAVYIFIWNNLKISVLTFSADAQPYGGL